MPKALWGVAMPTKGVCGGRRLGLCEFCEEEFSSPRRQGPDPRFCSERCRQRSAWLMKQYDVSCRAHREMFRKQAGMCAMSRCFTFVCRFAGHVDHCHSTGRVRGILCEPCNLALGRYEQMEQLGAAEYLKGGDADARPQSFSSS